MSKATKILYIEDDKVAAICAQKKLDKRGYVVDIARDGQEGLAKLEKSAYDLVAVDYHLPGMNGIQVLENLAESQLKIPVIMVTGTGDEQVAVEAMKLGAGDYLVKDVDSNYLELLPAVIESELEKQQLIIEKQKAEEALRCRDTILEALTFAAEKFLTCIHWAEPIHEVLAHLGEAVTASCISIFENQQKAGLLLTSQRYEWVANGIIPQIDNPKLQNFPYHPFLSRWLETLQQGHAVYGLVKNFPKHEIQILLDQKILSMAIIPVFVGKNWWGFIRYDDCIEEREWSPVVVEALKMAANLLGAAMEHELMNKALRESEARLAKAQSMAHLGHCEWDISANTRQLSEETCRILGFPTDTISNKKFIDSIHPDDRRAVQKAALETINEDKPYEIEFRIIRPDGSIRYLHALAELICDLKNKPIRFIETVQDITERKQAEKALANTLAELEVILDNSLVGIAFLGEGWRFVRVNRKLEEIFGYTEEELKGRTTKILYSSCDKHIESQSFSIIEKGVTYENEHQMCRKDGTLFWCRFLLKAIDPNDLSKGYVWNMEDVTEQRRVEENLRLAATVFETTNEGIFVTNADNQIIMVNPAFSTITGYMLDDVVGKNPKILSSGHRDALFYEKMWKTLIETGMWRGELWNRRKNGELYIVWMSIAALRDASHQIMRYVAVFSDITKRKEAEELIWRQANYDTLTELPNRTLFADRLAQAMRTAKRQQKRIAVIFIDLDRFKWVNDHLGHEAGDQVLKETARRLTACVRESDTVARLGGDEFTMVLLQIENVADVKTIAKRILQKLSKPFLLDKQEVSIGGSIGISFYPEDGLEADSLLKKADVAMYQAKEGGRNNFCVYNEIDQ